MSKALSDLLSTLRKHGVSKYSDGTVSIEFGSAPPVAKKADEDDEKKVPAPDDALTLANELGSNKDRSR